jgi:hypothetical protein
MPGENAAADKLTSSCDAVREGQVFDISHRKISFIADRFAEAKQSPVAA